MGQAEITQGRKTLKGKLRTVLFLVEAGKSANDIQRKVLLLGAPIDAVAQLIDAGYVAELGAAGSPAPEVVAPSTDPVANFRVAKAFMNDTIVDSWAFVRSASR